MLESEPYHMSAEIHLIPLITQSESLSGSNRTLVAKGTPFYLLFHAFVRSKCGDNKGHENT